MLPNFLIIGAEKSGTTSIHRVLRQHEEVYLPATKEPHYFNAFDSNLEPSDFYERLGLEWYSRFFDGWSGESAVGEATPMYLCDTHAPERIEHTLGDVRLIVCLRNPIDRAYSHFQMAAAKGHTGRSFEEVVAADEERFIGRGDYRLQLDRYLERFPRDNLLVLVFEELFRDSKNHLDTISAFLGIDATWSPDAFSETKEYGAAKYRSRWVLDATTNAATWMRTHRGFDRALDLLKASGVTDAVKEGNRRPGSYPPMAPDLRATLRKRYESGVRNLEELLDRHLPWTDWADSATGQALV